MPPETLNVAIGEALADLTRLKSAGGADEATLTRLERFLSSLERVTTAKSANGAATTEGDYEPPWLAHLREIDPKSAAEYAGDPRRVSKLDKLLARTHDDRTKAQFISLALNNGLDPDDPMFHFAATVLELKELFGQDHRAYLNANKQLAEEAVGLVRDIKNAASRLDGNIAELDELVNALPPQIKAAFEAAFQKVREFAAEAASQQVQIKLGEEARIATAEIEQNLAATREAVATLQEALKGARLAASGLTKDTAIILGGLTINRRTTIVAGIVLCLGLLFGALCQNWFTNATGIGLSPFVREDVGLGRTYRIVYRILPAACRSYVDKHFSP